MKRILCTLILCLLAGCATTPTDTGPVRVINKLYDKPKLVQYPNGDTVYKREAYWVFYSDGTSKEVSKVIWDSYNVPVIRGTVEEGPSGSPIAVPGL